MIIAISGLHGTGKSTIGKLLAEHLGIDYYSTGQAFRDLAKEKNMTVADFTKFVENHPEIDNELDDKVIEIAKKGNIVVDSQLSGYLLKFIADFKILFICPLRDRVKRMTERDFSNFETKLEETILREKSELKRFRELYDFDLNEKEIYDIVIDTQNLSVKEILDKIISKLKNS